MKTNFKVQQRVYTRRKIEVTVAGYQRVLRSTFMADHKLGLLLKCQDLTIRDLTHDRESLVRLSPRAMLRFTVKFDARGHGVRFALELQL